MTEMNELQQHISGKFNAELRNLYNQTIGMGGLVEEQLEKALQALMSSDEKLAKTVYNNDYQVDTLEITIDEEANRILALRQPTASDLRLVMAVIKIINDLERIGDEAERIARMALQSHPNRKPKHYVTINHVGAHVRKLLRDTLESFAHMDIEQALHVMREEQRIDDEYESVARQLMTFMMEDPREIPIFLNIMWSARALERIAAHCRNICESMIYFVKGKDVRHISLDKLEAQATAE